MTFTFEELMKEKNLKESDAHFWRDFVTKRNDAGKIWNQTRKELGKKK